MRRAVVIALIAAVVGIVLIEAHPAPSPPPDRARSQSTFRGPLIEVVARRPGGDLYALEPRTLERVRRRPLYLPGNPWGGAFSPDGSALALGSAWRRRAVWLYDLARWQPRGAVDIGGGHGQIAALSWVGSRHVVALVERYPASPEVVTVDVRRRRVVRRDRPQGLVVGSERTRRGLLLLLAPAIGRIAPVELVLVSGTAAPFVVRLPRIVGGFERPPHNLSPDAPLTHAPGLAASAAGRRAFVVSATSDELADVDLTDGSIRYRSLAPDPSPAARLHDLIEPPAEAKIEAGNRRQAALLGDVLAVTGENVELPGDPARPPPSRPFGLRLVDTRTWKVTVADRGARTMTPVGSRALVWGSHFDTQRRIVGDGVTGYGSDGRRLFRRFPGRRISVVLPVGDLAYVKLFEGRGRLIDPGSGRTVRVLEGHRLPQLIQPRPGEVGARGGSVSRVWPHPARRSPARKHAGILLGRSARGRTIRATAFGAPRAQRRLVVVGCIHGDECAGMRVVRALEAAFPGGCPPTTADIWTVASLNPDGRALGTRLNGRGVDLNRNFPTAWRPGGRPWDPEYPGPRPLSEPEARIAARLVRRVRPTVTVWFHQQADPLVRAWGRSIPAARRYAQLAALPFVPMRWPDGTAPNWQNHLRDGGVSFVVELPLGRLPQRRVHLLARAIARLAG